MHALEVWEGIYMLWAGDKRPLTTWLSEPGNSSEHVPSVSVCVQLEGVAGCGASAFRVCPYEALNLVFPLQY